MIEVKVSSSETIVQLINFASQAEADAWMAEMPNHPEWYPPGDYQLSSRDITQDLAASEAKVKAQEYLDNTDWMVIRSMDNGVPIPQDVKDKRQQSRLIINPT